LLGIEWGHIHFYEKDDKKINTGMSGVIPAWHILDLMNSEKLKAQRRKDQEEFIKKAEQEGTTETAAGEPSAP
jgi:hypothetical protein